MRSDKTILSSHESSPDGGLFLFQNHPRTYFVSGSDFENPAIFLRDKDQEGSGRCGDRTCDLRPDNVGSGALR